MNATPDTLCKQLWARHRGTPWALLFGLLFALLSFGAAAGATSAFQSGHWFSGIFQGLMAVFIWLASVGMYRLPCYHDFTLAGVAQEHGKEIARAVLAWARKTGAIPNLEGEIEKWPAPAEATR